MNVVTAHHSDVLAGVWTSPAFPDWSGLGSCHFTVGGLVAESVGYRGLVVEGGVPPFLVVEDFDVFEDGLGELGAGVPGLTVQQGS
jgi:hypothetical protein